MHNVKRIERVRNAKGIGFLNRFRKIEEAGRHNRRFPCRQLPALGFSRFLSTVPRSSISASRPSDAFPAFAPGRRLYVSLIAAAQPSDCRV